MTARKIAYISESAPGNKHAWSGTVHYVYQALKKSGHQVFPLGPARPGLTRLYLAALNKLSVWTFGKRIDYRHLVSYTKAFGRIFSKKLKQTEHDLVVVCGSTECGAYLKSTKPVVYVLDRTIGGAINYHTILSGLWDWSKQQSVFTDKKAMLESSFLFFSSNWAAQHAKELYSINPQKIKVLPFGANMDQLPARLDFSPKTTNKHWKLLLVGTYWLNKGADIALNALLILQNNGIEAELTVVGCSPPHPINNKGLNVIPFVDKNSTEGQKIMEKLFSTHDVFILPTRFDCTPIVFCEASAFGLPVLSADTGGVAGHVAEGVNGHLIPYHDKGEGYAKQILAWVQNIDQYNNLRNSSRQFYERQLNWDHWVQAFNRETDQLFS